MSSTPPISQPGKGQPVRSRFGGSRRWATILIIAFLGVVAAMQLDAFMLQHLRVPRSANVAKVAGWISETAKAEWPILIGLILWLAGQLRHRLRWRRLGLLVILASLLAGLSASTVRGFAGRTRPTNTIEQGWFGPYHNGRWLVGVGEYNSFPSGHAATAAGVAFALLFMRSRSTWCAGLWALAVAWSRIALNNHHFSDVVAGSLFGLLGAWWVVRWMNSDHFKTSRLAHLTLTGDNPASNPSAARANVTG